jgi:hypothetical protein
MRKPRHSMPDGTDQAIESKVEHFNRHGFSKDE